jgi:hypothetical protein
MPTVVLIILVAALVIHLACTYANHKGWIKYRDRTRPRVNYSSNASAAFNALQQTVRPSVVHLEEAKRDKKQESPQADDDFTYWR